MKKGLSLPFYPTMILSLCCFFLYWSFFDRPFSYSPDEEQKPLISHQHRFGINKDLWIVTEEGRHHHHLNSPESTLTLIPSKKGIDAVESMQQIRCWLQQKVDPVLNEQKIQYIKAGEGTYFYRDQEFLARNLIFAFYEEKGSDLPLELHPSHLFFKGRAQQAYFHLQDQRPEFDADQFQVEINET